MAGWPFSAAIGSEQPHIARVGAFLLDDVEHRLPDLVQLRALLPFRVGLEPYQCIESIVSTVDEVVIASLVLGELVGNERLERTSAHFMRRAPVVLGTHLVDKLGFGEVIGGHGLDLSGSFRGSGEACPHVACVLDRPVERLAQAAILVRGKAATEHRLVDRVQLLNARE